MISIFLIFQILSFLLVSILFFATKKELNIPVTVHSSPFIAAFLMSQLFVVLLFKSYIFYYFMAGFGIAFATFSFIGEAKINPYAKYIFLLVTWLMWPQALWVNIFYYYHQNKIVKKIENINN